MRIADVGRDYYNKQSSLWLAPATTRLDGDLMRLLGEEIVPESRRRQWPNWVGSLFRLGPTLHLTIAYILSAMIFLGSYSLVPSIITFPVRLVSGLVALIIVQGAVLATLLLPKRLMNIGTTIFSGIFLAILQIHLLYNMAFLGLRMPLVIWMLLMSLCTLGIGLVLMWHWNKRRDLSSAFQFGAHRPLVLILGLGLLARVMLLCFAQNCIAPDASLYADYARGIMNGIFQSSVSNDSAVIAVGTGVDYIVHQATTYIFALSWLLASPGTSGPTLILVLIGLVLLFPCFSLTERWFGSTAAIWSTSLVAIHPLFVFHSAVAYGPEISSLLFVMFAILLLVECREGGAGILLTIGVLMGLIDAIWYANFYLICITLPAVFLVTGSLRKRRELSFSLLLPFVLVARLYLADIFVFFGVWAFVYIVLVIMRILRPKIGVQRFAPMFIGIMITEIAWLWPLQIAGEIAGHTGAAQAEQLVSAILAPLTPTIVASFAFFLIFHLSIVLTCMIPVAMARGHNRQMAFVLVASAVAAAAGTLKVLSTVQDSLQLQYIYSDSRFFLFATILFIMSLGPYFAFRESVEGTNDISGPPSKMMSKRRRRALMLVAIIAVGYLPGYVAIPYGLDITNIEQRYTWQNLTAIVSQTGSISAVYLADRGREFTWLTGRHSAILSFSRVGLPTANANNEIIALAKQYNASYLVVDPFTIAHWQTIRELLEYPIAVGASLPLWTNTTSIPDSGNHTGPVYSITLVGENSPDSLGRQTRVFRFNNLSYTKAWNANLLSPAWTATNGGAITNSSGYAECSDRKHAE